MNEIKEYNTIIFESIKHIDEFKNEYWLARELMIALEYSKWKNFISTLNKSKLSCELSKNIVSDHFAEVGKTIKMPKGAKKQIIDYKLSRYACYLIVQNADPRKKIVSLGQTYFAVQTRRQELTDEYLNIKDENIKQLIIRKQTIEKNKTLYKAAKKCGVNNYGKFTNYGYKGLYGGLSAKKIAIRKNLKNNVEILDYMNSE